MEGNKIRVKKGDTVMVIAGKDNSKTGKVLKVISKKERVVIEGLNIVKKQTKSRGNQPGGIEEKESPVHISNIMLYCAKCKKAVRIKRNMLENGDKVRICVKCGEAFDR